MITLTLPYPVSANRYWRHARNTTYLSPEADQYRLHVASACLLARITEPLVGLLELHLVLRPRLPANHLKRERKEGATWWHEGVQCMDLDNCQKVALDAMQDFVYGNDSQFRRIVMDYGYPVPNGALSVTAMQWREVV